MLTSLAMQLSKDEDHTELDKKNNNCQGIRSQQFIPWRERWQNKAIGNCVKLFETTQNKKKSKRIDCIVLFKLGPWNSIFSISKGDLAFGGGCMLQVLMWVLPLQCLGQLTLCQLSAGKQVWFLAWRACPRSRLIHVLKKYFGSCRSTYTYRWQF